MQGCFLSAMLDAELWVQGASGGRVGSPQLRAAQRHGLDEGIRQMSQAYGRVSRFHAQGSLRLSQVFWVLVGASKDEALIFRMFRSFSGL